MSLSDHRELDDEDLGPLAAALVDSDAFVATGASLATHPMMLGAAGVRMLAGLEADARGTGDDDRALLIVQLRAFLDRCRDDGLAAVFPPDEAAIDPQVVAAIADDMYRADAAETEYDAEGDPRTIGAAADAWRLVLSHPAVTSAYPGLRAALSNNAGRVLLRRYWAAGADVDLDEAEDALRRGVALTPVGSALRAGRLANLGLVARERYRRGANRADLDRAMKLFESARDAVRDVAALPAALVNLALGLQDRFLDDADPHDLDRAIDCAERAFVLDPSPGTAVMLADLERQRFARDGVPDALETAVRLLEWAVGATPVTSPDRPRRMVDLGIALVDRHATGGDPDDLTIAINLLTAALGAMLPTSPDHPATAVHLALARLRSYEATGALDDLACAAEGLREATQRNLERADAWAWNANLAVALHERARRLGTGDDLDEAITLYEAVAATPTGQVDRFSIVNNLGNALRDRYQLSAELTDLDRAVDVLRRAVALASPRSSHAATLRANLGGARLDRFAAVGADGDLEQSIDDLSAAADLTAPSSLDRPRVLYALALALRARYDRTGNPVHLDAADRTFREGCAVGQTADLAETVRAGEEWGVWAAERRSWRDATVAFDAALASLLALVRVQLGREHKETWLRDSVALARRAAYAHVMCHRDRDAVMAVEVGRAVLLTDALHRDRLMLATLAGEHADLVGRFRRAAQRSRRSALLHIALD